MQITKYSTTGSKGKMTVDAALFGQEPNQQLLAQAVRVYQANQHLGEHQAKRRGEVARTTRKWYRQKGTGNARHGARSAPIFVGGGKAHGPRVGQRSQLQLNKALKRKALSNALSWQRESVIVVEGLAGLKGQTKAAAKLLQSVTDSQRVLVVIETLDSMEARSLRNLPQVELRSAARVNAFDIISAEVILFSPKALETVVARLSEVKTEEKGA